MANIFRFHPTARTLTSAHIPKRVTSRISLLSSAGVLPRGMDGTSLYMWGCTIFCLISLRGVGRGLWKEYKLAKMVYPPRQKLVIEVPLSPPSEQSERWPCYLDELFEVSMFLWFFYIFFFGYVLGMCIHGNPQQSKEVAAGVSRVARAMLTSIQKDAQSKLRNK